MAKKKKRSEYQDVFEFLTGWQNFLDSVFLRYTGKTVGGHLQDFAQRRRELPQGEKIPELAEDDMALADAYVVMGLPQTASWEEVKRNYRNLANLFHPDHGGYNEALVLLNRAYARIKRERGKQ